VEWPSGNHAIQRAFERYGLLLGCDDLKRIAELVHTGHGEMIAKQDDDRHVIEIGGCVVVYDWVNERIRTFLPPREGKSHDEYIAQIRQFYDWEYD
jgi:hypothetical protein